MRTIKTSMWVWHTYSQL